MIATTPPPMASAPRTPPPTTVVALTLEGLFEFLISSSLLAAAAPASLVGAPDEAPVTPAADELDGAVLCFVVGELECVAVLAVFFRATLDAVVDFTCELAALPAAFEWVGEAVDFGLLGAVVVGWRGGVEWRGGAGGCVLGGGGGAEGRDGATAGAWSVEPSVNDQPSKPPAITWLCV